MLSILPTSKIVNILGKYLYKHIDGAFKYKVSGNMNDIYMTLLYQRRKQDQDWTKPKEYNDVHEMVLNLNVTTYANKIRINIYEVTPKERTIGFDTLSPDKCQDLEYAKDWIYSRVCKRIAKAYQDYEFLF